MIVKITISSDDGVVLDEQTCDASGLAGCLYPIGTPLRDAVSILEGWEWTPNCRPVQEAV